MSTENSYISTGDYLFWSDHTTPWFYLLRCDSIDLPFDDTCLYIKGASISYDGHRILYNSDSFNYVYLSSDQNVFPGYTHFKPAVVNSILVKLCRYMGISNSELPSVLKFYETK